ncbi:hypothetical protein HY612_04435 [Candidatus Roizmanbacteria bacterium]|nr:hypothetical protein [Candidatus Roizmanbacteria bacterium]
MNLSEAAYVSLTQAGINVESSIQLINGLLNKGKIDPHEWGEILYAGLIGAVGAAILGIATELIDKDPHPRKIFWPLMGALAGSIIEGYNALQD